MAGFLGDLARGALMQANENMKVRSEQRNKRDLLVEERLQQAQLLEKEYGLKSTARAEEMRLAKQLEDEKAESERAATQEWYDRMTHPEGEDTSGTLVPGSGPNLRNNAAIIGAAAENDIKGMGAAVQAERDRFQDKQEKDREPLQTTFIEPVQDVVKDLEKANPKQDWTVNTATGKTNGLISPDDQSAYMVRASSIMKGANALMEANRRSTEDGKLTKESTMPAQEAVAEATKIEHMMQVLESPQAKPEDRIEVLKFLDSKPKEVLMPFVTPQREQIIKGAIQELQSGGQPAQAPHAQQASQAGQPAPVQQPQGNAGPAVGTVEDGYVFNGGNPADPSNWSPVSQPVLGE